MATHGAAIYAAGNPELPCGEANLDNAPFLAMAFSLLLDRVEPWEREILLQKHLAPLWRGLACIPLDADGLVWNDSQRPHSPYGFTDCIGKTGTLMMESLLLWRACRMLASHLQRRGDFASFLSKMERTSEHIENALEKVFYQKESGMLLAATQDCRQIDVWGSCYALSVGFPLTEGCAQSIRRWLIANAGGILEHGQLRHTAPGEFWERLLLFVPQGEYQNGAYWATATGWFADAVHPADPALAERVLEEAAAYFEEQGIFECVNGPYRKLNHFVVSAANTYGAAKRLFGR